MSLATLVVSPECFEEIACRLAAAGHKQIFLKTPTGMIIDMKGLAIVAEQEKTNEHISDVPTCLQERHDTDCMCHLGYSPRI